MKLIVMRHGEAGLHSSDALRPLTPRGESECARVGQLLATSAWRPAAVWCSSLLRAQQTARIVADWVGLEVTEQPWLKPEDPPGLVIDALQRISGEAPLLLVSHMPLVGALVGRLVEDRATSVPMATSQAICLDMAFPAVGCAEFCHQFWPDV